MKATAPLAVLVASVLLMGGAVFIRSAWDDASSLVARGVATSVAATGQDALRDNGTVPDEAALRAVLDAHAGEGLIYLAVLDDAAKPVVQVGQSTALKPPGADGGVEVDGAWARVVRRLLAPKVGDEPRRALGWVVYELEPKAARALQRQASELVWVAGLVCLGALGLALALARGANKREQLTAELEKGRRLAALGEMSAVLAHELKNPLTSLKGHAQLLAEDLEQDPKLSAKGARIVSEALRLEQRMNDLLAFAKGGTLHLAPADASAVLRAAVESAGAGRVDVRAEPVTWPLDASRLQQALENVVRNAVEASPEGARVEASLFVEGGTLRFTVRDHGAGIADGDAEKIFEPFVTRKVKGVGLGLAVTRRIIELHGGTITARNVPPGGAELALVLPKKET
ncbi:MAG: HAMP domain-containing sensor histidine kinase [Myxococcaceae bacterium]